MRASGCSLCYLNNNMEGCWTEKHGSLAKVKPRSEAERPGGAAAAAAVAAAALMGCSCQRTRQPNGSCEASLFQITAPLSLLLSSLTPTARELKEAGGERKDGGSHGADGIAGTDVGHSQPAHANCCAKELVKSVSPHPARKR